MKPGKISNELLKKTVLGRIKTKRQEVVLGPGIGEDCCAVNLGGDLCVLSTDPITGAVNEIGSLAVHVSCNDIASCGAEPVGIMITILAPLSAEEKDFEAIMKDVSDTADKLNVDILGGHTEITDAVSRFVLVGTCIGRAAPERLVTSKGAKPGDVVVMTGSAGTEGISVIAHDREKELSEKLEGACRIGKGVRRQDQRCKGRHYSSRRGVSSMHIYRGRVLGAVWELCRLPAQGRN